MTFICILLIYTQGQTSNVSLGKMRYATQISYHSVHVSLKYWLLYTELFITKLNTNMQFSVKSKSPLLKQEIGRNVYFNNAMGHGEIFQAIFLAFCSVWRWSSGLWRSCQQHQCCQSPIASIDSCGAVVDRLKVWIVFREAYAPRMLYYTSKSPNTFLQLISCRVSVPWANHSSRMEEIHFTSQLQLVTDTNTHTWTLMGLAY